MYALTALSLFIITPSILGFFQTEKDQVSIYLLASNALIGMFFTLYCYVPLFRELFPSGGFFIKFFAVGTMTLAVILAFRLKNRFLTGMLCMAAGMILMMAFRIIRGGMW